MLETTILKVRHNGEQEARKLLPHIQGCDVFCPEFSAMTEQGAIETETLWERILCSAWSRSQLHRYLETAPRPRQYPGLDAYQDKMWDLLHRSRKPIFHVERFNAQQSVLLQRAYEAMDRQYQHGLRLIQQGAVEEGAAICHAATQDDHRIEDLRDREIGRVLGIMEPRLRAKGMERDPVRVAVHIGSAHRPEQYAAATVVSLVGDLPARERLGQEIGEGIAAGASVEALLPLYVAVAGLTRPL